MQNEHICATALYYYDCDNITESLLAFRQQVDWCCDLDYGQDDHEFLKAIYGAENDEAAVQNIGEVVAKVNSSDGLDLMELTFPVHTGRPRHIIPKCESTV